MKNFFSDLKYITLFCCVYFLYSSESATAGGFRTTQIGPKPIWNETHVDKLKKDLLMNYDKYARPEHHYNATTVNISISVLHLETDESKSMFIVYSWLRLEWTDSKLKWNESNYGGLSIIRVGDHEVWQPDIYLYNSASGGKQLARFGNPNVLVYSNGEVQWVPPVKLTALCEFNLRYWPFDTQHCYLRMGSWVYGSDELLLKLYNNHSSAEVEPTISGSAWAVDITSVLVTQEYLCCPKSYTSAVFNFTLTRKSAPYCAIIVTPAVVTTFLILMQFWLPPQAGEKIIVNGFTFVVLNLFLLYFNHQVTGVAPETPLIVLFYSSSLYIVGFSMMGAIVSFTVCKVQKQRPLPRTVKILLQGILGKWLFLDRYSKEIRAIAHDENIEEMKDHQVSDSENETAEEQRIFRHSVQQEWTTLVVAIDRISFLIYCFVFVVLAIVLLYKVQQNGLTVITDQILDFE